MTHRSFSPILQSGAGLNPATSVSVGVQGYLEAGCPRAKSQAASSFQVQKKSDIKLQEEKFNLPCVRLAISKSY